MSYSVEVVKDTPNGLWILDDSLDDYSGRSVDATVETGSFSATGQPLVYGASRSMQVGSTPLLSFPFVYGKPGEERQPFTLEAWVLPSTNTAKVLSHGGTDTDGLYLNSGAIQFSIPFAAGEARVTYTPPFRIKMHVVGVYTGESLQLYVNGDLKDSVLLTDAQKVSAIVLDDDDDTLYHGQNIMLQAVATYQFALEQPKIVNHYKIGNTSTNSTQAAQIYNGWLVDISPKTVGLFHQKVWLDWTRGYYTCTVNAEGLSSGIDSVTGLPIASKWEDSFELDAGGTSINGVILSWEGQGTFTVETSLDGITWTTATNGKRIAAITSGYNPTDKILMIRISFINGVYGHFNSLYGVGIKSLTVNTPTTFPITIPSSTLISPSKEVNLFDYNSGFEFSGGMSLGPNTEDDAVGYKSIGFWYYLPSGSVTTNFTEEDAYINGEPLSLTWVNNRWTYVVLTSSTPHTTAITISGTNLRLSNISLYDTELTEDQVNTILSAFTGVSTIVSSESSTAVTITDSDASIYAADWSIAPAG